MINRFLVLGFLGLVMTSCNLDASDSNREPVARVGENYLYKDDISKIVPSGSTKEDSLVIVNNYINRWATKLLLVDGAERNLTESKLNEFEALVREYKNDLYTKAYLEALVSNNIDTIVSNEEALQVFEANTESFKLNEELIKFRYINLPKNAVNIEEVEERFKRFDSIDKKFLDSISLQFNAFSLKDSTWIKASQVVRKVPVLTAENKKELLKKSNYIQLEDSLSIYLMQINDVLLPNENAPLEYVKPTINQIVINKRKLELIQQLQKDITKDAIKNNQFEIYDDE